jgi:glycosyltransferase involved in cell wall biosynthesis
MKKVANTQPLVSVIMPVYNAAEYLELAIGSILKQTYKNWELIIIDDASTDRSWEIIQKCKLKAKGKLIAYRLDKNRNAGGDTAANIAYTYASGDYIARMDADDISLPHRLATQVAFLERYRYITIVGSSAVVIDQHGAKMGYKVMPEKQPDISREYFRFHPMINPTVMINRALFPSQSELYEMKNSSNNDYYSFFKLLCLGHQFANIPEPLLKYRIHSHNDSLAHVKRSFRNTLATRMEMVKKYHYVPSFYGWVTTFVQAILIFLLPEKVLFSMYLHLRGIKHIAVPSWIISGKNRLAQSFANLMPQRDEASVVTVSEQ